MFRYDRPQKGRFRMHYQFGAEVLGSAAPAADVEVLSLPIRLIQTLGLTEVQVRLNSVGDAVCRPAYVEALRTYFRPYRDQLCADCQRRLEVNPLRILECKEPGCHKIAAGAPRITEYLDDACRAHFEEVKQLFGVLGGGLDVFVAAVGEGPAREACRLLDRVRIAGLRAVGETSDRGLRAQMKQADRLGARFAVILGEQELAAQRAGVRDMQAGTQQDVPLPQVIEHLAGASRNGA